MIMLEETARMMFKLLSGQKVVFVTTEPGLPDFSAHGASRVVVSTLAGTTEIPIDRENISDIWGLLVASVFSGEYIVLSWGLHSLLSYARFYTKTAFEPPDRLYDLKAIEKFMGVHKGVPKNCEEAIARQKAMAVDKAWVPIWKQVYHPLITKVLPDMETVGLIHVPTRSAVYTHYEVEYQKQGRMDTLSPAKGFRAHGLGKSPDYRPRGEDVEFILLDYMAMEVHVLQYLSKCPVLGEIINSGEDVYRGIFRAVTGKACVGDDARSMVKNSFLPVVYGMGASALAERLKKDLNFANNIINRYCTAFPEAFGYIRGAVPSTATIVRDYFGRPRPTEANDYLVRNFVIQAPSSTICLERLVALHEAISGKAKLAMHIHDGYAIVSHKAGSSDVYMTCKSVLESESSLCPGLKLKADGKVGPSLDQLAKP